MKSREHKNKQSWYAMPAEEVVSKLGTDRIQGLDSDRVSDLKALFGNNEIVSKNRETPIYLFIKQMKSTFIFVLFLASIISFVLGDTLDAWVILAAVVINAFVGTIQEGKANRSLEALSRFVEHRARVVRDGKPYLVEAKTLVPGDLITLSRGDRVPADIRIIESHHVMVNESMFTGESIDVEKHSKQLLGKGAGKTSGMNSPKLILPDQRNMLFMGSLVTAGTCLGVVVEIGMQTAMGSISALISKRSEPSALQVQMDVLAKKLGGIIFVACIALFVVGFISGMPFLEIFTTSVAVAVSAIPEGLAVVVTIVLALGMRRLADLRGLVKTLPAAESIGCASVVCTDKTGTLTSGIMTVKALGTKNHDIRDVSKSWFESLVEKPKELLTLFELSLLCNDAQVETKDSAEIITGNLTDQAILRFVRGFGFSLEDCEKRFPRLDSIPFDSDNKFMATLHKQSGHNLLIVKGSPELILSRSRNIVSSDEILSISSADQKDAKELFHSMTQKGMRVLGVAYKELPIFIETLEHYPVQDLTLSGFIGLVDPIRPDVPDMVKQLTLSGVRIMMVTGDNRHTAISVAREIGLQTDDDRILDGDSIDGMNTSQLMAVLPRITVCARIVPEHKLRIVEALRESGDVVAMTGDGVNDAPALRRADIGVALESGTDVAKEAAHMILLNNSFATIGKAVFYGRAMFANIRKIVVFLLSDNFIELFMIAISIVLRWEVVPIVASQILWKNLIVDGLPAFALSQERESGDLLLEPPRSRFEPILIRRHKIFILFVSALYTLVALLLFFLYWRTDGFGVGYARSVAFAFVCLGPLINILNLRSLSDASPVKTLTGNRPLLISLGVSIGLLVLAFSSSFMRNVLHLEILSFFSWLQVCLLVVVCAMVGKFLKEHILLKTSNA